MARIGIMGGTFDPIHNGHLILAEQAWEKFELDKVLFIPAADPPHKTDLLITDVLHRYNMTVLAVKDNRHFECSKIEMDRPGPSYTVDTIKEILGLFGSSSCVYLLVGADEARDLMSWREPYTIQKLSTIVAANRPGYPASDTIKQLPKDFAEKIELLDMPGVDISSTDLRERVRSGRSIKYLVPDPVEKYIMNNKLYGG